MLDGSQTDPKPYFHRNPKKRQNISPRITITFPQSLGTFRNLYHRFTIDFLFETAACIGSGGPYSTADCHCHPPRSEQNGHRLRVEVLCVRGPTVLQAVRYGFGPENVGYIPNDIAIFHRDNDQQNHWV